MGINYFTAFGFAFIATAAFGILFQAPRKSLPVSGVIGAVGWVVYCYIRKDMAYDSFYAMFFATVALSLARPIAMDVAKSIGYSRYYPDCAGTRHVSRYGGDYRK